MRGGSRDSGFVLIFALWVVGLLTVLAVSVAAGIRQKMVLIRKLDERSRMAHTLEGGLVRSMAYVRKQLAGAQSGYTASLKELLFNNPAAFEQVPLQDDSARISYTLYDGLTVEERFGVVDEERKVNLNTADTLTLQRLFERALALRTEDAKRLAQGLLDWRQAGESELTGFYSQDYYANLQYPYPKKNMPFDVLDEILLVKGVTRDLYERMLPYVTIYGDGAVNINTAPAPVLYALGLEDTLIEKILTVRRGRDGIEDTGDDHVFAKTFDVGAEVNAVLRLEPAEMRAIDALNLQRRLTCTSAYFSMQLQAELAHSGWKKNASAVIFPSGNRILYWREK